MEKFCDAQADRRLWKFLWTWRHMCLFEVFLCQVNF